MKLDYPDLTAPPKHWTAGRTGHAIRLVPPGAYLDRSRAAMVVSPLVPVSAAMPQPEALIRQALAAEVAQRGLTLVNEGTAVAFEADSGLTGVRLDVQVRHATGKAPEYRGYVMCRDSSWLYGLSYIADEVTWPIFLATFEAAAASVVPA